MFLWFYGGELCPPSCALSPCCCYFTVRTVFQGTACFFESHDKSRGNSHFRIVETREVNRFGEVTQQGWDLSSALPTLEALPLFKVCHSARWPWFVPTKCCKRPGLSLTRILLPVDEGDHSHEEFLVQAGGHPLHTLHTCHLQPWHGETGKDR